ncbi:MAG: FHA domain-containing protein [Aggregatilineales bacterium]
MEAASKIQVSLMSGPQDGRTFTFVAPDGSDPLVLTIGRRDTCNVTLSYDTQVSRLHARLIYDARDTEFFLEDAGSRNGTFLGTTRVRERVTLESGELFRIGRTWLRIEPWPDQNKS